MLEIIRGTTSEERLRASGCVVGNGALEQKQNCLARMKKPFSLCGRGSCNDESRFQPSMIPSLEL